MPAPVKTTTRCADRSNFAASEQQEKARSGARARSLGRFGGTHLQAPAAGHASEGGTPAIASHMQGTLQPGRVLWLRGTHAAGNEGGGASESLQDREDKQHDNLAHQPCVVTDPRTPRHGHRRRATNSWSELQKRASAGPSSSRSARR